MSRFFLSLMAAIIIAVSPNAFPVDIGNLDRTFASSGIARIGNDTQTLWASGSVIQPDGKILIAGSSSDRNNAHTILLVRLHPDGQIDDQFGDKGIVKTKIGRNCYPRNISLTPDGRIIVAGWAYVSEERVGITLAMYTPAGTLDSGFGNRGILIFPSDYLDSTVQTLAVQRDGKILISGGTTGNRPFPHTRRLPRSFLLRINSDGTFDSTFGDNAVVAQDSPPWALRLQDDGKIVAAQFAQSQQYTSIVITRYDAEGKPDKTFGANGKSVVPTTFNRIATGALFALGNGQLVTLLGSLEKEPTHSVIAVRLNQDGSLDSNFGQTGVAVSTTQFWHYSNVKFGMSIDGTYWIAGHSLRPRKPEDLYYYYDYGVAHLLTDGKIDSSFGSGGMRVVSVGSETDDAQGVVVEQNSRPIVIGHSANRPGRQIVAIRF